MIEIACQPVRAAVRQGAAYENDRLGSLLVVTGVILAALRYWPLRGCGACVIIPV